MSHRQQSVRKGDRWYRSSCIGAGRSSGKNADGTGVVLIIYCHLSKAYVLFYPPSRSQASLRISAFLLTFINLRLLLQISMSTSCRAPPFYFWSTARPEATLRYHLRLYLRFPSLCNDDDNSPLLTSLPATAMHRRILLILKSVVNERTRRCFAMPSSSTLTSSIEESKVVGQGGGVIVHVAHLAIVCSAFKHAMFQWHRLTPPASFPLNTLSLSILILSHRRRFLSEEDRFRHPHCATTCSEETRSPKGAIFCLA
ncbi:uncharacterized protein EV420DRAFT_1077064 [Desarmillaria tabescens]|uniref:Uncharacterized protein n=1 Tax=Armillaria tabescens TaxID=1929756 RepID=A0AA39MPP2_ARMTA|nr:uncharacterized protein EV420DRAFT_1077064 [Desarmillaria tabescens]KAK0442516.1 hypothetical protein EV420DRAFT_1077064 [Desarmillaria tabescens]